MKTAAVIVLSVAGTMAAVLAYERLRPAAAAAPAASAELLQRMKSLEQAVTVLAGSRANPQPMVTVSAPQAPPRPIDAAQASKLAAKRDTAIRAGHAVIDEVVSSGRLTQQDGLALAVATAGLEGDDLANVYARLSREINEGRVHPERNALGF